MLPLTQKVYDTLMGMDPKENNFLALAESFSKLVYAETAYTEKTFNPVDQTLAETLEPPKSEVSTVEAPKKSRSKAKIEPQPEIIEIATVRGILSEAAKAGVVIKDIITKYVPEGADPKLSSVPATDYAKLLAEKELLPYAG